jgi:hypothetical protein
MTKIPEKETPNKQIRAVYDANTIRVYQAYNDQIADAALANGTFVSPSFKLDRMTWIKPSFLWMMYRAGWGLKDPGQRRILAIDITHEGFNWALKHSCSSHPDRSMSKKEWKQLKENKPVRIQWDPERDLFLRPLDYRTIQIGLSQEAIPLFVHHWIQQIRDVTPLVHTTHSLITRGEIEQARNLIPNELPLNYPV